MRSTNNRSCSQTTALAWRERTTGWRHAPALAWWHEPVLALGAFEWVALGYLGVSSLLILLFYRNLAGAATYLAAHARVAALLVGLRWAGSPLPARGGRFCAVLRFARHWYPQAFCLFCFEELNSLVHLIFPGWFDRERIAFDYWLLGVHPTVWLEQFASPPLNDFMQMSYLTYFFYLPILAGILYHRGERRAFWSVTTSTLVAYSICYLTAVLFSIQVPFP